MVNKYLKVVHSWKWYNNLQNMTKQKEKANKLMSQWGSVSLFNRQTTDKSELPWTSLEQ